MLVFRAKLFDGVLTGTGNVYTQTADAELLGSVERLTLGVAYDGVTGTNPTMTLQLENSPDGTRWMNQSATPEYAGLSFASAKGFLYTTSFPSTTVPIGGFVRIRLALGGTSPSGYFRLWAVGRNPAF
jgi:hypothetical protein